MPTNNNILTDPNFLYGKLEAYKDIDISIDKIISDKGDMEQLKFVITERISSIKGELARSEGNASK